MGKQRVQFSLTEEERKKLEQRAWEAGYPDMSSYCKDLAMGERTYGILWENVVEKIKKMDPEEEFFLRDLIAVPPALLGTWLYDRQKELGIAVIKKEGNVNKYKKL